MKNERDSQYQHVCEHKAHITAGESVISRGRRTDRGFLPWDTSRSDVTSTVPKRSHLNWKRKNVFVDSFIMQFNAQYVESDTDCICAATCGVVTKKYIYVCVCVCVCVLLSPCVFKPQIDRWIFDVLIYYLRNCTTKHNDHYLYFHLHQICILDVNTNSQLSSIIRFFFK